MRLFIVLVGGLAAAACSASPELASSPDADRIFEAQCVVPSATSGPATFDSIYNELVSTKGVARCQDSTCHGGAMGQAGLSMGTDKKGAYDGLVAYGQVNPTATTTDDPPATVKFLINIVSPSGAGGAPRMPRPLCGNRALNAAEIDRLKAWGRAGAKND